MTSTTLFVLAAAGLLAGVAALRGVPREELRVRVRAGERRERRGR